MSDDVVDHSDALGMRCWKCHDPIKDEVTIDLRNTARLDQHFF
jgi:hypothetical protein